MLFRESSLMASPKQLSFFRVSLCLYLVVRFITYIPMFIDQYNFNKGLQVNLPIAEFLFLPLVSLEFAIVIFFLMISGLLLSAFSNKRFIFLIPTALLFVYFNLWRYSFAQMPYTTYSPHDFNAVVIVLLFIAFNRNAYLYSLRELFTKSDLPHARDHSVFVIKLFLSLVFLQAVYTKMSNVGVSWMDGQHLQQFILWRYLISANEFGYLLAQNQTLCMLGSIAVIAFQSTAWILILRNHHKIFVIVSLMFFLGVRATLNIDFWTTQFSLYLIFLNVDWFTSKSKTAFKGKLKWATN